MSGKLIIEKDGGTGRAFVMLAEAGCETALIDGLFSGLSGSSRCIVCKTPSIDQKNWRSLTESVRSELKRLEIRQASFVAFEDAGILVQHLALEEPKFVRSIVLVDGVTSPHPGFLRRIIDFVERSLPLGLPLRSSGEAFDGRAYLQRIRCPVLVVTRSDSSEYYRTQAGILGGNLSTCWTLEWDGDVKSLEAYISEFQGVPVKCPQKVKVAI